MNERFEFAFDPAYRLPGLVFGVRPATAHVTVTDDELRVRFGPWHLATSRANVAGAEITQDFRWLKTAGPPHLSFADRGVTFATNGRRALCVSFTEPVVGIDPTRTIRHPGATLTVAHPELLHQALL